MRASLRALACVVAVAVAAVGIPATAAPPGGGEPATGVKADRRSWVTLVTGDRVEVAAGRPRLIDPARRSEPAQFARYSERGDWYVVPSDASRLIRAGVVDRELFNVTGLVRQGYDDAHTKVVPLLAEYPDMRSSAAPAGARKGRVFPESGSPRWRSASQTPRGSGRHGGRARRAQGRAAAKVMAEREGPGEPRRERPAGGSTGGVAGGSYR